VEGRLTGNSTMRGSGRSIAVLIRLDEPTTIRVL